MMYFSINFFISAIIMCSNVIEARLTNNNGKIVGGTEADIQDYPYMASLIVSNGTHSFLCGGSIISEKHILTAAHCLENIVSVIVRIGSSNSLSGGKEFNSSSFASHPKYDTETYDYDVAVIKIENGMDLDGNATKIPLIRRGSDIPENTTITVTGWGATSEGGDIVETLMKVDVPTVSNEYCQESLGAGVTITTRMFCAGYDEGGRDSCQGDSGGPAVSNGRQYGIVSSGIGCARPMKPGIYTNIAHRSIYAFIRLRMLL